MPMVDLTLLAGALTEAAIAMLVEELTSALIEGERAPDNKYVRAITWTFVDPRPASAIKVAGRHAEKPVYRVVFTDPEGAPGVHGAVMQANRERLVKRVAKLVLDAEGTPFSPAEAQRGLVQTRRSATGTGAALVSRRRWGTSRWRIPPRGTDRARRADAPRLRGLARCRSSAVGAAAVRN